MNNEFFEALEQLEKEKGISQDYMLEKVENALIAAFKREHGGESNVRIAIDREKKEIRMYQQKEVVEVVENSETQISLTDAHRHNRRVELGAVVDIELKPQDFRRLSAQTGKQVIIQAVREAERGKMYKEYESKREEIMTVTVQKINPLTGDLLVDTGTSHATLLKAEQLPNDSFAVGDHIKVFLTEVRKETRGPLITLSRTHPNMVKRLFELDVPEIQDGTVIIQAIAREAGSRTKMAVYSRDPGVDPVGACIGARGLRIASIVEELGGEKIDVVRYSEDPARFIADALSPANVQEVVLDGEKSCRVYVDPDQLSLAIGKVGQNARLAAKLTGFKIDIKTK
ncbi:MAG: transcription termination factor NusA [Eubacteriales bacterium]